MAVYLIIYPKISQYPCKTARFKRCNKLLKLEISYTHIVSREPDLTVIKGLLSGSASLVLIFSTGQDSVWQLSNLPHLGRD